MRIYVRKIFPHDITHEISVTTDIVKNFFDGQTSLIFVGKTSAHRGTVTINSATDPRFGGDIRTLIDKEGTVEVNDLLLIEKCKTFYTIQTIRKSDERYQTLYNLFEGKDRHVVFSSDEEENTHDPLSHNFYGIHITNKNNAVDDSVISIGWSCLGELSDIDSKEALSERYDEKYPDQKPRKKAQDISQV